MGKYNQFNRSVSLKERESRKQPHPVWRGIGFILMILIPFLAYFSGLVLIEQNNLHGWFAIPAEYFTKSGDPYLYIKIGLTVVISLVLYGVISLLGVMLLSVLGPSRYGPLDAPPIKRGSGKRRWQ
jgi:hypothetical protein